jgi:hypothetical protein
LKNSQTLLIGLEALATPKSAKMDCSIHEEEEKAAKMCM